MILPMLLLLLFATLGEGGANPSILLGIHGGVLLLVLPTFLRASPLETGLAARPMATFAVFLLFVFVGVAVAPYAYAAILVLIEILVALAVLAWAAGADAALLRRLPPVLLGGAAAQAVIAIVQWMGGNPRPAGTFLNASHLGAWLAAALLLGVGAWSKALRPSRRLAILAGIVLAGMGILVSGSRGAAVGLVVGGVAWLAWAEEIPRRLVRRLLLGVLFLAVVFGWAIVVSRRDDPQAFRRLSIWKASAGVVLERPWGGTGPGQFRAAALNLNFPLEGEPLRYARFFETTHSDPLRLPVEFGVPAALMALAATVLAAREIVRRRRHGPWGRPEAAAASALIALTVQASVDNLSMRPAIVLLAAVLAGALLRAPLEGHPRRPLALRITAASAVLLAFLLADVGPTLAWRISASLPRPALDGVQGARLSRAVRLNPLHPDLHLRRAEALASDRKSWGIETYLRARESAETAVRLDPRSARYHIGLARIERQAFATLFSETITRSRVVAAYESAMECAVHDPLIPLELADFLLEAADPRGARRAAERALRIEPNAVPAHLLRAEALARLGGPEGHRLATRDLEEAEALAARWQREASLSTYHQVLLSLDAERARSIRARLGGG